VAKGRGVIIPLVFFPSPFGEGVRDKAKKRPAENSAGRLDHA